VIDTRKIIGSVVISLTMVGCSAVSTTDSPSTPVVKPAPKVTPAPPVPSPQPPARPPGPSTSSAWQPLVDKAAAAATRGDFEQALALLERAQRIDPGAGAIYLEQAKVHQARGDRAQARTTAERGLLYCSSLAQCDALRAFVR
jgi:tetratricopeptide (TPR) repeat protein